MSTEAEPLTIPAGWDMTKVIPGQAIAHDGIVEDIAPGVLEPFPERRPVLRHAGSAAMVVASVTGRAVGLSAYGGLTAGSWLWAGLKAGSYLGYRYVRAHDLQEVLGGMSKGADWNKVQQVRRNRWRFLAWSTLGAAGLNLAGWWALVAGAGMTALDYSWAIPPSTTGLAILTTTALYGRYRLNAPDIAPEQVIAEQDDPNSDEPFPLGHCTSGEQVAECVSRALAYKGIGTRSVDVLGYRGWGWEVDAVLNGASLSKVNAIADELDSIFDVPRGGTLIEPDPDASAHFTLRLVTSDPFADMARPAVHAPNSMSVRDAAVYGRCMDGSTFELRLRGMFMMIIGSSGSAKTKGALRCIAEAITACRDAIAIEMDPVKDGIREFSDVMALPPVRGKEDCTTTLRWLRDIASARNQVKSAKEMGDLWEPSPKHPAIYGLIDEFIFLSQEAKELAIEILRIGRETGVYLIFAAQEATQDSLGDAIASAVTYRVMLAARSEDIPLVLGKGAVAQGYRPDRLRPAVDDERIYDAGKFYIAGPGFVRPVLWRWNRFDRDQIRQAVKDRAAVGRPWFDHDSLAAADLLHVIRRNGTTDEASLADRLDRIDHDDAAIVAQLLRTFEEYGVAFLPTSEVLIPALNGVAAADMDSAKLARILQSHSPTVKAGRDKWGDSPQVRGWFRAAVEQAAAGLIDPSKARLQAA
ncbi:hypothetical protein PV334_19945 [Streptomyces sp. ME02-7008A-1]|uniref:hypothetical protein n=1 Tax=unclassified Streptomyces TaxID=2593676 RepID=UPI0029AAF97A|nr:MULTISPECIES: hypothetical protein [unclassified Streptomyces]MDX3183521.1 hypothetical protein [Streptomyces sp. ME02-7008A-1]MDX3303973.1 hypothetical protein [Streptomyces sp. ME02-7008A]